MALARLVLFPNKGDIWVNHDHVASVVDGPGVRTGQSGTDNAVVTIAGPKAVSYQVHGRAGTVSATLSKAGRK
jgi:hypothetical protein